MSDGVSINICFAATGFGKAAFIGGPSYSQRDSLMSLLISGAKVCVVSYEQHALPDMSLAWTGQPPEELTVPVGRALKPRLDRSLIPRFARWCGDAVRDLRCLRTARALKPDVLWVEGLLAHRMIEDIREWNAASRVFMMRGSPDQISRKYADRISELPRSLAEMSRYTHIACPSERVLDMWRSFPELRDKQFLYLPNCAREEEAEVVSRSTRDQLREKLGLPKNRIIIVCVGSVQYRKGQDILVTQFARSDSLRENCLLLLAGIVTDFGGGQLHEFIEENGLSDSVRILGHRADALELIRAADLLVLPSREEALPLAVLEAMVLKTPIVASNVCGVPELVRDGIEALLFDPAHPDTLGVALRRMYEEPKLREACADRAHTRYGEQFSRQHHIARYRAALTSLMVGR